MDDVKTVTHEGTIYQIGKAYLVDDGDNNWILIVLRSVVSSSSLPFRSSLMGYRACKEAPADSVGTITPAPIDLVNGAAYMFEVGGSKFLGFYKESQEAFFDNVEGGDGIAHLSDCTNIRPMAVVEGVKS